MQCLAVRPRCAHSQQRKGGRGLANVVDAAAHSFGTGVAAAGTGDPLCFSESLEVDDGARAALEVC